MNFFCFAASSTTLVHIIRLSVSFWLFRFSMSVPHCSFLFAPIITSDLYLLNVYQSVKSSYIRTLCFVVEYYLEKEIIFIFNWCHLKQMRFIKPSKRYCTTVSVRWIPSRNDTIFQLRFETVLTDIDGDGARTHKRPDILLSITLLVQPWENQ